MSERRRRSPRSAPCPAPASSTSPPRRPSAASAPAIRPGATSARASPRPGRCPARPRASHDVAIDVDDQEYAPVAGIWELREAIAGLYNRLYRRGHAVAVHRRERLRLGRRARGADPRGGQPRPRQPRPLPARLHRLRGAARHLQGVHRHPDPARGRARLRLHRRRSAPRGPRPRAGGAAAVEPLQPDRQAGRGARSWRAGCGLARELDCALLLDEFYSHYVWTAPRGRPADRERRPLRRGRRPRSGGPLRRAHEELALPRLARHLDGRPEAGHRGGRQRRARSSTAAGRSRCSARRSRCSRTRTSSPRPTRSTRPSARSASACWPGWRASASRSTAPPTARSTRGATSAALPPPLDDGMGFFRAALEQQGDRRARASSST